MKKINQIVSIGYSAIILLSSAVSAQDWPQWRGESRDSKVNGFKQWGIA